MRLKREGNRMMALVSLTARRFARAVRAQAGAEPDLLRQEYEERFYDLLDREAEDGMSSQQIGLLTEGLLGIACFVTARRHRVPEEELLGVYERTFRWRRMGQRVLCQLLEWLPGGFRWVKRRALGQMTKTPGWTAQVEQNDSKGAELRVTVCPYLALCRRYQCAGLCQAFCQNEQWAYGRLRRKVRFVRYETLLEGSCCHMALLNVTGETQQRGKKHP
jgi:hypothetical protein